MLAFTVLVLWTVWLVERAARRKNAKNHVRRMAMERISAEADNVTAWFGRHPPVRMDAVRGHPPRPPRARGRSAARGDYFPFDDEFPSNLGE
ncbi:MAG: hypothetical protein WCC90_23490 [Methylocella sp.]